MTAPARLPDAASLEAVRAALDPASADTDLVPTVIAASPGFAFGVAAIEGDCWHNARSIIRPSSLRVLGGWAERPKGF